MRWYITSALQARIKGYRGGLTLKEDKTSQDLVQLLTLVCVIFWKFYYHKQSTYELV